MEVLIVDDEPLIQEILAAVERKAFGEARVVEARDLESAFQRLAHHGAPDLALLDLGLPGQRGLDSLKRFRWKFPQVPVVVVVRALEQVAAGETYVPPQAESSSDT